MAAILGTGVVAGACGQAPPSETGVGVGLAPVFGGRAVSRCRWTNVVAVGGRCSGVLLHPEVVVYAAHCGETISTVRGGSREVSVRYCRSFPEAQLGATDMAYCRLAERLSLDIVPPAMGCESEAIRTGSRAILVGYGPDEADGQYGIRREASATIKAVNDAEIVVGSDVTGICPGDSGGPLMIEVADGAGATSLRVAAIASASPVGPCRASDSHYFRLAPHVDWLEKETGVDLTPCGDSDGIWDPTPGCVSFRADADAECGERGRPPSSSTCGPAFEPAESDAVAPLVEIVRPRKDEIFVTDPDTGIARVPVEVRPDDEGWGVSEVRLSVTAPDGSTVLSESRSIPPYQFDSIELPDAGSYALRVLVSDHAGSSTEAEQRFEVRREGPRSVAASGCSLGARGGTDRPAADWIGLGVAYFLRRRRWNLQRCAR